MSITTLNGVLAGAQAPRIISKAVSGTLVAGRPMAQWYTAGIPGAGVASVAGINGEILTAPVSGQIPFTNPASGNSYLARLRFGATQAGMIQLIDKIWVNSGVSVTSTSLQSITALQIPARDMNGTTTGDGVYAAIEVTGATGAGTPTITLAYKNTANQDKTATNTVATVVSSIAGTWYPIGLAAGDTGIQKVTGITLSATWTSGTIAIVLYRVIAELSLPNANTSSEIDCLKAGFPRIFDNSVLTTVFYPQTTTSSNIQGSFVYTQG